MDTPEGRAGMSSWFAKEKRVLFIVTVSGILYNLGLLAGPWFEGRLAQCLYDVFGGSRGAADMLRLCVLYVLVIAFVQGMRFVKRFYVRRFANHVNRNMKGVLYGNLIHKSARQLEEEDAGSILTKAISDVDACSEGMRKFVTEIFDTGVAMAAYAAMLLWYDWRLGLLCMIFPPAAGLLAEKMKVAVESAGRAYKESAGRLNAVTLDRAAGAVTYRVFGCEAQRDADYGKYLEDYEKKAVRANIRVSAMQPIYRVIAMAGAALILWFGAKNVLGNGWSAWDLGTLTTFLACYGKLAVKASHVAKLFNSVQKARVSWDRIRPLMETPPQKYEHAQRIPDGGEKGRGDCRLELKQVSFGWGKTEAPLFEHMDLEAHAGQIIGITGPVACGKSSFGQLFYGGIPYKGSIRLNGCELRELVPEKLHSMAVWQGHDTSLLSDSIRNNVLLGDQGNIEYWLGAVCMDQEVRGMEQGADTRIGNGGVRLSGGQQARIALARTLSHKKELIVLDDPFAALDKATERQIFQNLRELSKDSIVLLITHRLYLFPQMDQVVWMADGQARTGTHEEMLANVPAYAALFAVQQRGEGQNAED